MSIRVIVHVFNSPLARTSTEQVVLLAIAENCDDEGGNAWPSIATIARKTRLTERAVYGAIERLKARGVLRVTTGGSRCGTNLYEIALTSPERPSDETDDETDDDEPVFIMRLP